MPVLLHISTIRTPPLLSATCGIPRRGIVELRIGYTCVEYGLFEFAPEILMTDLNNPLLKDALFGGSPEEAPERYKKSSPITYAENVKAPVLIIQGRNDTRTPARQVEDYEKKMKSLDKDIEVVWYDTGHTGSVLDVEEGIKFQEIMLKFAWRVLGL